MILARGAKHPKLYSESLIEIVRVAEDLSPVSRLNCTFATDRAEDARWYADTAAEAMGAGHVYRVEPADPEAPSARCDAMWQHWLLDYSQSAYFDVFVDKARRYWTTPSRFVDQSVDELWERLFPCALRVVEEIPDDPTAPRYPSYYRT